jgi:hypothetical protein
VSDKPEKTELPNLGVSLPRFQAAVETLVGLRENGTFLLFLGRRTAVKLVGDPKEFQLAFSVVAKEDINQEEANATLEEVRRYCSARAKIENIPAMIHFLENLVYEDEFKKHKGHKAEFHKQIEEKSKLVSEKLFTTATKGRATRIESATVACLEDVDFELVQSRCENLYSSARAAAEPFLRLRVRYSDGSSTPAIPPFVFFYPVWGDSREALVGVASFELECDESDIDLLVRRLLAAKNALLSAREHWSEQGKS